MGGNQPPPLNKPNINLTKTITPKDFHPNFYKKYANAIPT
jgi:hypothetical protein|tara:strand:- start:498 stop:617 length:120 start_codon:yes stop_codon:yes gene_type:complete